jgi:hypothetical protein
VPLESLSMRDNTAAGEGVPRGDGYDATGGLRANRWCGEATSGYIRRPDSLAASRCAPESAFVDNFRSAGVFPAIYATSMRPLIASRVGEVVRIGLDLAL